MITTFSTLFNYIMRQFLKNFLGLMLILLGVIIIFDIIELLRRSADIPHISLDIVFSMAGLKLPYLGERMMPMGVLFSAIYTCWKLNKTSELVVIRSVGLSAWQFLSPIIFSALMLGVFSTTILSPIAATFLSKRDQMNATYFQVQTDLITVSKTGIWLRQPSKEGYSLIHSKGFDRKEWKLNEVSILFFDNNDTFLERMDSPVAFLKSGYWDIKYPVKNNNKGSKFLDSAKLATNLTAHKIEESFADPETISFWRIPEHITIMEETGFPATRLHLHFHRLLAQPLLFSAMILLAAMFSLRPPRFGGAAYMVVLGVSTGFFVFFMESLLQTFGIFHRIPIYLAAWSPAIIGLLIGGTALLHLEDG